MSSIVAGVIAADTVQPYWANLAQYGVLGVVLLLIIFGKLVPGYILVRKDAEADKRNERITDLEDKIQERIIPAIVECNKLMTEVVKTLDDIRWNRAQQQPQQPSPPRG